MPYNEEKLSVDVTDVIRKVSFPEFHEIGDAFVNFLEIATENLFHRNLGELSFKKCFVMIYAWVN